MQAKLMLENFDWSAVARTARFMEQIFSGPPPDRPGCIVHPSVPPEEPPAIPPVHLDDFGRQAWREIRDMQRRPMGGDDFIPMFGTSVSTCALATAFGAEETQVGSLFWVKPCLTEMSQIDRLKKPPVTAGRLGGVLERTRLYAERTDDRIPIKLMDFQSPFTTVEQLVGSDAFFLMPYDEPARLHAIMDIVTDFLIDFFRAQKTTAGSRYCTGSWPPIPFPKAAGIQMSDDNLVNVSPEVYEEFVVPYNNRIAEAFGGLFLHSCTITPEHLPAVRKHRGLTGVNCDLSTSVSLATLLDAFGRDIVVAPHVYINTNTRYRSYDEFIRAMLAPWRPEYRLFVYPCVVLYLVENSTELAFDEPEVRLALEEIPAWRRDHGR